MLNFYQIITMTVRVHIQHFKVLEVECLLLMKLPLRLLLICSHVYPDKFHTTLSMYTLIYYKRNPRLS